MVKLWLLLVPATLMAQNGRTYPIAAFSTPTTPPACTTPTGAHETESFGDGPSQVTNYYQYCGIGGATGCARQWAIFGVPSLVSIIPAPDSPPANSACNYAVKLTTGGGTQAVNIERKRLTPVVAGVSQAITSGSTSGATVTIGMAATAGFVAGGTIGLSSSGIDPVGFNGLYGTITSIVTDTSVTFTAASNPGTLTWVSGGTAYAGFVVDFDFDIVDTPTVAAFAAQSLYLATTTPNNNTNYPCQVAFTTPTLNFLKIKGQGASSSTQFPTSGECGSGGAYLCQNKWYRVIMFCGNTNAAADSWISLDGGTTRLTFQSNTTNTAAWDIFGLPTVGNSKVSFLIGYYNY